MTPNKHATALLLCVVAAAMAGCTSTQPSASDNSSATGNGLNYIGVPATTNAANGTWPPTALHNITVNVAFTTPGFADPSGGYDAPTCDPAQPGVCWVNAHETLYPTVPMPFNGTFLDILEYHPDSGAGYRVEGIWIFTGSITGCKGSGTVTFPFYFAADPDPVAANPSGEFLHGHDYLSAPTNSTGFALIADAKLDADFDINPITGTISRGLITGYLTCE